MLVILKPFRSLTDKTPVPSVFFPLVFESCSSCFWWSLGITLQKKAFWFITWKTVITPLHKPHYENISILSCCVFLKPTDTQNCPIYLSSSCDYFSQLLHLGGGGKKYQILPMRNHGISLHLQILVMLSMYNIWRGKVLVIAL